MDVPLPITGNKYLMSYVLLYKLPYCIQRTYVVRLFFPSSQQSFKVLQLWKREDGV